MKSPSIKEKEILIDNFCKHLKKGYSEFSFKECDYREIEEYAKELDKSNKKISQVDKIKKAIRESFYFWENMVFEILEDEKKKYFFPAWIYYVKARFNWGMEDRKKFDLKDRKILVNLSQDSEIKEIEKQ